MSPHFGSRIEVNIVYFKIFQFVSNCLKILQSTKHNKTKHFVLISWRRNMQELAKTILSSIS
jgi:hypothetical protein